MELSDGLRLILKEHDAKTQDRFRLIVLFLCPPDPFVIDENNITMALQSNYTGLPLKSFRVFNQACCPISRPSLRACKSPSIK
jgi:hypothetical protein